VTVAEMRHFIALAYAAFQLRADQIDWVSWQWVAILRTLGSRMKVVASFNYDLGLERALDQSHVQNWRVGSIDKMGSPWSSPTAPLTLPSIQIRSLLRLAIR
jgi:hypothetical protein